MSQTVRVEALTPLLFRDGRPFTAAADESRATSLPLPPPATVAGLLRTHIGTQAGWDWADPDVVAAATRIRLANYHVEYRRTGQVVPVVAAPLTAVVHRAVDTDQLQVMRLSPQLDLEGGGCDLPERMSPLTVTADVKPEPGYRLWGMPTLHRWLAGHTTLPDPLPEPPVDERVQIANTPGERVAATGMLFTTQYRAWEQHDGDELARWSLVATVENAPPLSPDPVVAHFGGERRPVLIRPETANLQGLEAPAALRVALVGATQVTMQLLTPGVFTGGWRPGWVDQSPAPHPALAGVRLVAAAVGRPETVSGWSYEAGRRGPKPTWWAVPAGSTYFLRLQQPLSAQDLTGLWLTTVSDRSNDRDNGYGTAVWGVWD